jgi:RimJ/RimL family protein N-acetyltransferase
MEGPDKIRTENLLLRKYRIEDAVEIFTGYAQDKDVVRYLTWKPHRNIEDTKAFVKSRIDAWKKGDDFSWAITTFEGRIIGGIALRIRDYMADFGYVIAHPYWSKGYATEALRTIVQWALRQPQIFRVWGCCDIENNASARVMEKCGLEKEGVLKKWGIHPQVSDTPRDCLCYSIVRSSIDGQSE